MTREQLLALTQKRTDLLAAARVKFNETQAALQKPEPDLAVVKSLQAEYDGYMENVAVYAKQIEAAEGLVAASAVPQEEPVANDAPQSPTKAADVARLPFQQVDAPVEENDADKLTKAIHIARVGEVDEMTKMLTNDIYGPDYMDKRMAQREAFTKYVRFGEKKLNGKEEALLNQIIMTPEQIRAEVKMDSSLNEVKSVLNETQNELGGFLVPEDYRVQMTRRIADTGIVRSRARVIGTSRDSVEWPVLLGGNDRYTSAVRITWIEENPTDPNKALTNPSFGMKKIPVHTAMARVDLSQNQLEDTAFNMMGLISELFGEAAGIDEDIQFISGVGGDAPRGILGNRLGSTASPLTDVEAIASGASSTITSDGLIDLIYALPAQYRRNAVLMGNRFAHRDVRKLKNSSGDYYWQPALAAGEPPTVSGFAFAESESFDTPAIGNYPIAFGDWGGYVVVDRMGMSIRRMEDTGTMGSNKVALFMKRRVGGDLVEPWRFKVMKIAASV